MQDPEPKRYVEDGKGVPLSVASRQILFLASHALARNYAHAGRRQALSKGYPKPHLDGGDTCHTQGFTIHGFGKGKTANTDQNPAPRVLV